MIKLSEITFVEERRNSLNYQTEYIKVEKPSEESISLVTALLASLSFQVIFSALINNFSLTHKPEQILTEDDIEFLEEKFPDEVKTICRVLREFGLGVELEKSLFLLITFKLFINLDPERFLSIGFCPQSRGEEEMGYMNQNIEAPYIFIRHKISINQLVTWINENKAILNESLETLPKSPILKDKLLNIALIDEIYELFLEGQTTKMISDYLVGKYPDHPYVSGYEWINNKIQIFKKRNIKYSKEFVAKISNITSS